MIYLYFCSCLENKMKKHAEVTTPRVNTTAAHPSQRDEQRHKYLYVYHKYERSNPSALSHKIGRPGHVQGGKNENAS